MKIDIHLERDPRFAAAKAKLYELQSEVSTLEGQRNDADAGLSSMVVSHASRIELEASALLTGGPAFVPERERLTRTLTELTHRLAVVRQAVVMQRQIVDELRGEVGRQIATDLLPQHRANVAAVVKAALQLNVAVEAEQSLRDTLNANDVPYTSVIRAMPLNGFLLRGGLLDGQGRLCRYLLECEREGFCSASALPDVVRAQIPPKAKPTPPAPAVADSGGWGAA